ncbi:hypothetical protein E4U40_004452 [Claviceps sp. LM458 group G5]|nr:hypothetical protein E4U40_004452 [Claviceps sp. LM458 group G5]
MAPKKKEQQKMSLGDFLTDGVGFGNSWADEVEETYRGNIGTQPLPPSDRPRYGGSSGAGTSSWQDRGYSVRESEPQRFPDKPPYTAHLGNLSYDATTETVTEFFEGCDIVSVRIIEDRELMRPKGFGYVEFTNAEGLTKALTLDGESFQGRMIKIKIADPPRGGDGRGESTRDLSDWSRKGPLPDLPGRNGGGRPGSDFGGDRERRSPRDPAAEPRAPREMNWERRGPLAPLSPQESGPGSRDGSRPRPGPDGLGERGDSHRGSRQGPAAWGEGRQEAGARPLRRPDQPERVPTAAEKDFQWRTNMKPDAVVPQQETESPASASTPAAAPAPVSRPRLNLQKRTVSEAPDASANTPTGDAKASPFGAARPINTAAREQAIEEKRQQALREKKEAEEKAKEERRLAKLAAAEKEESEKAEKAEKAKVEAEEVKKAEEAKKVEEAKKSEESAAVPQQKNGQVEATTPAASQQKDGAKTSETQVPETRELPKEAPKSKATESINWRSASNDQRGPPRGGHSDQRGPRGAYNGPRGGRGGAPRGGRFEGRGARANGTPLREHISPPQGTGQSEAKSVDEDGWTTVPNKKGRQGRA